MGLACGYQDIERDMQYARCRTPAPRRNSLQANCQIQVLSSLFFRNKAAYIVGRIVNGSRDTPFAVPILHDERGGLSLDAILFGADRPRALFSFSRAYFMVDMEVPSAYVQFLRTLMPRKPRSELYTMLGLHKQGKTLFYRDLLQHLRTRPTGSSSRPASRAW